MKMFLPEKLKAWRGFIDKLPSDEDKLVLTKLLDDWYKYPVAMNNHAQIHPFPAVFNYVSVAETTQAYLLIKVDDTINKLVTG